MVYHEFTIKTRKIQYAILDISTKKNSLLAFLLKTII